MHVMVGYSQEGVRQKAISLTLFAPYGIGYAMSYQEAMDLESDVADDLIEAKSNVIDAMARKR